MKVRTPLFFALACFAASIAVPCYGQTASGIPHLRKQGSATQLIVDGKPFLAVTGEMGNNTATSLENMKDVWPRLVSGNLNCVLAGVSWAQVEPTEGKYEFAVVDGLIRQARENHLKLVFLWFASWKNGTSSYPPVWVKQDYKRFPRIEVKGGRHIELLSTFGDASRDADARAFRAFMGHIKLVDGQQHTVLMIQVENEVGVLRDSRDRSPAANKAFAGPVPKELMDYLLKHKDTLAPELRQVMAAQGDKTSGTWEEVFGPGKPDSVDMPVQTSSPPMSREEHDTAWRQLHWPVDEIFMAWNYARYVNKVVAEGKAEYPIPMYVNGWLQQPNMAWPGTYPSGGPLPQVHDIWRAGAPAIDILAPDLYLEYFDEVCGRFTRNGNPLFIPETSANPVNVVNAFVKWNAIGYSPFGIERSVGPDTPLAATYKLITSMSSVIAAQQGKNRMAAVRLNQGDPPQKVSLGDYTLTLTAMGMGRIPIAPEPTPAVTVGGQPAQGGRSQGQVIDVAPPAQGGRGGRGGRGAADQPAPAPGGRGAADQPPAGGRGGRGGPAGQPQTGSPGISILIAAGPNEFYMSGGNGNTRVSFTPNTPGPPIVGLGDVQVGKFVDGKWVVVQQLAGDDTGQGELLTLRANSLMRVTVYRYE
jgi:hypothetical protein